MATLNKSQTWARVLEIIETNKLSDEIKSELSNLLEPKKGQGKTTRIVKTIDDIEYRNCRFTGRLWKLDDLVYQNDKFREEGKDKGYSLVGISLWNKGQKHIKDVKNKLTELILSDIPDVEKVEELKTELKSIETDNLGNQAKWLNQFATEDQLKTIKNNSYELDVEV